MQKTNAISSYLRSIKIIKKLSIIFGFFVFLIIYNIISTIELKKTGYFTFIEREHSILAFYVEDKLQEMEGKSRPEIIKLISHVDKERSKTGLHDLLKKVMDQPVNCLASVTPPEVLTFRLLGFGKAIDLCYKDIDDINEGFDAIESFKKGNINKDELKNIMSKVLFNIKDNSFHFSVLIPEIRTFVSNMVLITSIVFAIIMVPTFYLTIDSIKTAIKNLSNGIETIKENNNVSERINDEGDDEISKICFNMNAMLETFECVVTDIYAASQDLSVEANRVHTSSDDMHNQINNQHRETEHVISAITQMGDTIRDISENTTQSAEATRNSFESTKDGKDVVNKVVSSIQGLSGEMNSMNETIKELEDNTSSIGSILDVIRSIAEQTNLLALNAAIEAARAGEQGRGFAVVADEVRSLASRTQHSTQEIQGIIESLQDGVKRTVIAMESGRSTAETANEQATTADSTLSDITSSVGITKDMSAQIASATEQQRKMVLDLQNSLNTIQEVSSRSSQSSEEMKAVSLTILDSSKKLEESVGQFSINH